MNSTPPLRRSRRGFSFLELTLVALCLAVLAAGVTAGYAALITRFHEARIDTAATQAMRAASATADGQRVRLDADYARPLVAADLALAELVVHDVLVDGDGRLVLEVADAAGRCRRATMETRATIVAGPCAAP